jgi:hypothetical protein
LSKTAISRLSWTVVSGNALIGASVALRSQHLVAICRECRQLASPAFVRIAVRAAIAHGECGWEHSCAEFGQKYSSRTKSYGQVAEIILIPVNFI